MRIIYRESLTFYYHLYLINLVILQVLSFSFIIRMGFNLVLNIFLIESLSCKDKGDKRTRIKRLTIYLSNIYF